MIILVVRPRSWIVGVLVVDSFEFCSIYFSSFSHEAKLSGFHVFGRIY